MDTEEPRVLVELRDHVLVMTLNRARKRNAFDERMFAELTDAYTRLDAEPAAWCGALIADGPHFTAGADLGDVAGKIMNGIELIDPEKVNPWQTVGVRRRKPVVIGAHGRCLTLGIELLLAADVRIADATATFAQLEVKGGILPFGGASARFVAECGWGNAMRWMLTGDDFDAAEALRIGLVQEVVPAGAHVGRCLELASLIAHQAPLGVQATIRSAVTARTHGELASHALLKKEIRTLLGTEDARIGMEATMLRRPAEFVGR